MATTKTLLETAMLKLGGVGTMPSTNADYISVSTTSPTSGYESYIAPTDG